MSVHEYKGASELLGPLQPNNGVVDYRPLLKSRERIYVRLLTFIFVLSSVAFTTYLAWPGNVPDLTGRGLIYSMIAVAGIILIVGLQIIQLIGTCTTLNFALRGKLPVPMEPEAGLRIAMLTTIVPSKEPWEQARDTMLMFQQQIVPEGTVVDAWILDEGDDPDIKADCERLGFYHFSRKGVERWNRKRGEFRAKTKHGNHNAWRDMFEHDYDIVTQMDPDHRPLESRDFLQRLTGYFSDPDVAFVVAPQVYGNAEEGVVAKGAAELAYLFHGVIQPGANGMDAPLLIGTNHAFRPAAWHQLGGYQDCIIEDHLTAMQVPAAINPETGNHWKGVYTPDILTAGEGPNTWTDFFSQQKRWAYGIFEILTGKTPKMWRQLSWSQRVSFASMQYHYPSVGLTWLAGNMVSAFYLIGGVTAIRLNMAVWSTLFVTTNFLSLFVFFWLRRFNLVEHERKSLGLAGMLLNLVTTPVYLGAGLLQLAGRPLTFKVTAKGRLASGDTLGTFRLHLWWAVFAAITMVAGLVQGHLFPVLYVWMSLTLAITLTPVALWAFGRRNDLSHAVTPTTAAPAMVTAGVPDNVIDLVQARQWPNDSQPQHKELTAAN